MSDLADRSVAELIVATSERVAREQIRRMIGTTRVGVVFGDADPVRRKVDVRLYGQPEVSPGFTYDASVIPADGDLVRVVIDPNGDRYVTAVLGRDNSVAAAQTGIARELAAIGAEDDLLTHTVTGDAFPSLEAGIDASGLGFVRLGDGTVQGAPALRDVAGVIGATDRLANGIVTTAKIATAARRVRWAPVDPYIPAVPDASTTTSVIATTATAEMTGLPTGIVAVTGHILFSMTGTTVNRAMTVRHWTNEGIAARADTAVTAATQDAFFIVETGGTNGRQMKYAIDSVSGTMTYWIRVTGYLTAAD